MRTPATSSGLDRPTRGPRRRNELAGVLRTVVVCLACASCGLAPDRPLDLKHENQARTALAQDADVAGYNLGVEVKDRVATLWGTLPNTELNRRAIELLKKLPEFREVRSDVKMN